jgi:hypothetical protein
MAKKFPLSVLESYAKSLTLKQAVALYENKNHKKATKALFERVEDDEDTTTYTFYFSPYVLEEYISQDSDMHPIEVLQDFIDEFDNGTSGFMADTYERGGYTFYTKSYDVYHKFINDVLLTEFEVPDDIVRNNIDKKYLQYIDK